MYINKCNGYNLNTQMQMKIKHVLLAELSTILGDCTVCLDEIFEGFILLVPVHAVRSNSSVYPVHNSMHHLFMKEMPKSWVSLRDDIKSSQCFFNLNFLG